MVYLEATLVAVKNRLVKAIVSQGPLKQTDGIAPKNEAFGGIWVKISKFLTKFFEKSFVASNCCHTIKIFLRKKAKKGPCS